MQKKQVTHKQIVTALLIGDGTLQWRPISSHYRIVTMSSKEYFEDYHMWKDSLLRDIFGDKVRFCKDNRERALLHTWVSGKRLVEPYYKFLYKNIDGVNKKQIKPFLQRLNHPMCLAIWFMDDGSCTGNKSRDRDGNRYFKSYGLTLCTNQFSYSDHEYMVAWFKKEFGVTPKIYKQVYKADHYRNIKDEYRLRFNSRDAKVIWNLIQPYVVQFESMRYKFRFAYLIDTLGYKVLPEVFELEDYTSSAEHPKG